MHKFGSIVGFTALIVLTACSQPMQSVNSDTTTPTALSIESSVPANTVSSIDHQQVVQNVQTVTPPAARSDCPQALPGPDETLLIWGRDQRHIDPCAVLLQSDATALLGTNDLEAVSKSYTYLGIECKYEQHVERQITKTPDGRTQIPLTGTPRLSLRLTQFSDAQIAYDYYDKWRETYACWRTPTRTLNILDAPYIAYVEGIYGLPPTTYLHFYRELLPGTSVIGTLTLEKGNGDYTQQLEDLTLKLFTRLNDMTGTLAPQ